MPSTAWSASRRSLAAPSPSYGGPRDRRVQAILAGLDQRIWHRIARSGEFSEIRELNLVEPYELNEVTRTVAK